MPVCLCVFVLCVKARPCVWNDSPVSQHPFIKHMVAEGHGIIKVSFSWRARHVLYSRKAMHEEQWKR